MDIIVFYVKKIGKIGNLDAHGVGFSKKSR